MYPRVIERNKGATVKLSYSQSGTQVIGTIVAFHGVTDNAASLADLANHYGHEWRVVLVDSLGHGLSEHFTEEELADPYRAAYRAAETVTEHIAASAVGGKVALIGHSMGGAIAAELAASHPEYVEAAVLEDPALLTPELDRMYRGDAPNLVAGQQRVRALVGEAIIDLQSTYKNWSPQEYAGWAQGKTQVDLAFAATGVVGTTDVSLLDQITVPTVLLSGDGADVLFDDERFTAITNPHVEAIRVSNATHTVRRDQSEVFYRVVDQFLERIVAQRRIVEPFIRPDMREVIATTPPQDTWDITGIRERTAQTLLDIITEPDTTTIKLTHCEARVIGDNVNPGVVVLSLHGGGYVAGHPSFDDDRHRDLARDLGAVIVSPDYRLAPEHAYPAAVDDALETLSYCAKTWPDADIVVYGDSAGSGLGAQLFAANIPEDVRARVRCFVALEPCLKPGMATESWNTFRDGPVWHAEASRHAWAHYLREGRPYHVAEPAHMPPTLVIVNSVDPLRDEGIDWARTLVDGGVHTELHMIAGSVHGGLSIPGSAVWKQNRHLISTFCADVAQPQ